MGNNKDSKIEEKVENVENGVLESEEKANEAIENLRIQLQEHLQKTEYHKTMATKAQGALEVLLQLYPQDRSKEEG